MKSQTRAWLMFALLCCLWGTLPVSPFSYFAGMIREWAGFLVIHRLFPAPWQAILIYLLVSLVLVTLLLFGRSRNRLYIAGICALAEMVHHAIECIRNNRISSVSLAIAIGLALALLFLLIKAKSPALWLSDAFTISLAAWLVYDGVIYALGQLLDLPKSLLGPLIPVPAASLLNNLDGTLGLPLPVWALLPLLLAVLPLVFLGGNRQKG